MQIEVYCGAGIKDAIAHAIKTAEEFCETVEFEFNGVAVTVASDSDSSLIYRDWRRGMSGFHEGVVGPYPPAELSLEQRTNDAEIDAANKRRQKAAEAAYRQKQEEARTHLHAALQTAPEFAVRDVEAWNKWQASNQDDYGKGVIDFAQRWARLMQKRMADGEDLGSVVDDCAKLADVDGITGMYGAAVSVLATCWEHGEELRRWHNLKTQLNDEGERANASGGVLNPAILSTGT